MRSRMRSCVVLATFVAVICSTLPGVTQGAVLKGTIRDFAPSHPDFESAVGTDPGIVMSQLGGDGVPVYAGQAGNPTTHGQTYFDQWFRDTDGVNLSQPFELTLTPTGVPGQSGFSAPEFFPIDGQLFGNTPGRPHNYHFTFDLHAYFDYAGGAGEYFSCTTDDDIWVFLNGRLAIDGGGVQSISAWGVNLDDVAGSLGLTPGQTYPIDVFHAERHTTLSSLAILTSMDIHDAPQTDVAAAPAREGFALRNAVPNPLRGTTTITFDLSRTALVDLAVLDVAGRRVRALVHELRGGGRHEITWNGSDDSGRPLPAGIYLCRMVADGFTATQRVLVLR